MNTKNQEIKKDPNELSEEKQIKNAIIDLLHNNEEVTDTAISKATGIATSRLEKHSHSIRSMLSKLKKVRLPGSM
jgi:hypothetical protein